jgi:hypothetical protein
MEAVDFCTAAAYAFFAVLVFIKPGHFQRLLRHFSDHRTGHCYLFFIP